MKLSIIETKTVPTIQVFFNEQKIIFHSKYDPVNEAAVWYKNESAHLKETEAILIIGLGAGYHIQKFAEMKPGQQIFVVEFNDDFFQAFKKTSFYEVVSQYPNVQLKSFTSLSDSEKETIFTSVPSTNFLIHKSGLAILPKQYDGIKEALEVLKTQQFSLQKQIGNLVINFEKNKLLNDSGVGTLIDNYREKPMILVSAGPSLSKQLSFLKKIRAEGHFVIGAVGTAVKPLVKFGIVPDFFMIIDPNQTTYRQLTNIDLPETTLFYLSTAYHETILLHTGPRRIVYQEGYENAEKKALEEGEPTIQTGGSVATALLDLMVFLGGKSIALIGQDFAFTDGKSHAEDTQKHKIRKGSQKVINYYQTGKVETASNLTIYRKWFEQYAKEHRDLHLYNCTEGGAYIRNWEHISFQDFYSEQMNKF